MTDTGALQPYLETAFTAARTAGSRMRDALGGALDVAETSAHDIKLQLDSDCQTLITDILLRAHPDTTVFGEEGGVALGSSRDQWIVDPIDGTVNFFFGFPHFCTTLALQHDGVTVLGVTYDPVRDEMFHAVRGGGAFCNGRPIRAATRAQLAECIISTGFAKSKAGTGQALARFAFLANHALKVRMNGCAALDLAYVASGRLDAYVEQGIRLWDIAAGVLLVEEAGGRVDLETANPAGDAFRMMASNGHVPLPPWSAVLPLDPSA